MKELIGMIRIRIKMIEENYFSTKIAMKNKRMMVIIVTKMEITIKELLKIRVRKSTQDQ